MKKLIQTLSSLACVLATGTTLTACGLLTTDVKTAETPKDPVQPAALQTFPASEATGYFDDVKIFLWPEGVQGDLVKTVSSKADAFDATNVESNLLSAQRKPLDERMKKLEQVRNSLDTLDRSLTQKDRVRSDLELSLPEMQSYLAAVLNDAHVTEGLRTGFSATCDAQMGKKPNVTLPSCTPFQRLPSPSLPPEMTAPPHHLTLRPGDLCRAVTFICNRIPKRAEETAAAKLELENAREELQKGSELAGKPLPGEGQPYADLAAWAAPNAIAKAQSDLTSLTEKQTTLMKQQDGIIADLVMSLCLKRDDSDPTAPRCVFSLYNQKSSDAKFEVKPTRNDEEPFEMAVNAWKWREIIEETRTIDDGTGGKTGFGADAPAGTFTSRKDRFDDAIAPATIRNVRYQERGGILEFEVHPDAHRTFTFKVSRCCFNDPISPIVYKGDMTYIDHSPELGRILVRRGVAKLAMKKGKELGVSATSEPR